jgi:hypothetical protein
MSQSSSLFVLGRFSGGASELPLAFSIHPSSIPANHLDPEPTTRTTTKDEEDWDMTLNRYERPALPQK